MPSRFSKKGGNLSPQLQISNAPPKTASLLLIVDDPDSPSGLWTHWIVANIPPGTKILSEGKVPDGAVQGKNSFGNTRYDGPMPPSGTHRYFFRLYALDAMLPLPRSASRSAVDAAMKGHVIGNVEIFGTYSANP
jgi:Raf kinase inhibitor-like YbhB/YbcL family protein